MIIGLVLDDTLDKSDGVQAAVLTFGAELTRRGHELHYLVAHTERTDLPNVHSLTSFVSLRFNGNSVRTPKPASCKQIRQLFEKIPFDVLHVQLPYSPLMAGRVVAAAPASVRIVGTFHILPYGFLSRFGTRLLGFWLRATTLRKFDRLLAVSEPALDFMESTFHIKGSVLPNPIEYECFALRQVSDEKLKQSIVFVGRFEERKGVMQLLAAYKELPQSLQEKHPLIMCGKGPLLESAQRFSREHKLQVTFTGFVSDEQKIEYLAHSRLAVFPSTGGESFGIVLAEAMAAGAYLTLGGNNLGYSSVLGTWPETVFDPNDTAAFTSLLHKALQPGFGMHISNAQHTAAKRYDVKRIVDELEQIYGA